MTLPSCHPALGAYRARTTWLHELRAEGLRRDLADWHVRWTLGFSLAHAVHDVKRRRLDLVADDLRGWADAVDDHLGRLHDPVGFDVEKAA